MRTSQEQIEDSQENMDAAINIGQEDLKTTMRVSQEVMEVAINSIRSIKNGMDDILVSVGQ
jgi:hypothetical protein